MKKSLLILMPVAGTTLQSLAQEGVNIGFRASPLISWSQIAIDSTNTEPTGLSNAAQIGFSFDFVMDYGFTENITFRSGLNIATKTIKAEFPADVNLRDTNKTNPDGFTSARLNITAVELPVGFKFRSPEIGDGIYVVGMFGGNAELNLANRLTAASPSDEIERRDVDGVWLLSASFTPGAGVNWEFDWGMLEMAATYHWGLTNITNPDKFLLEDGSNATDWVTKMNYIALNRGYFF